MNNHPSSQNPDEDHPDFISGSGSLSKAEEYSSSRGHYFLLLAMILWTYACNQIWVLLDTRPPSWDQAAHLRIAFGYWNVFVSGTERFWLDLLSVESFYPPFYHLSLLPVFALLGISTDNAVVLNSIYLAVIILSTYGIGSRLYGKKTGLLAAFLISCYPFLAYSSRQNLMGVTLTAVVTLSYYLFLRAENFENRKFSFWFSCTYAVGLMVKWTFFYLPAPCGVNRIISIRELRLWKNSAAGDVLFCNAMRHHAPSVDSLHPCGRKRNCAGIGIRFDFRVGAVFFLGKCPA